MNRRARRETNLTKKNRMPIKFLELISIPSPIEFFVNFAYAPEEVLHIGAHLAEEKKLYEALGIERSLWVEAQPEIFARLQGIVGSENALNTGVWSKKTVLNFKVARNSVSSSLLNLDVSNPWQGLDFVEEIEIETNTMDDVITIFQERGFLCEPFFVLLDIQGAEYEALLGWQKTTSQTVGLSCEVSRKKGYSGARKRWQIVIKLFLLGFIPCAAFLDPHTGHGDQLFIKLSTAFKNPRIVTYSIFRALLLITLRFRSKPFFKLGKD